MSVSQAEVDRLYDTVLKPRLDTLEGLRRELKRNVVRAALLVLVPGAVAFVGNVLDLVVPGVGVAVAGVGFALVFVGILVAGFRYIIPGVTAFLNYRQRFKHEVVAEIFKIVSPSAAYDPDAGLPQAIFDEPGLFSTRGSFRSDDHVRGRIGDTPFEAAEIRRAYSSGGKNSTTYVVFHGLFFHLDFNKSVRGLTIVQPESAPAWRVGARDGLTPVALENPEFEREFAVHASDEVEARYILTPAMMEQLLAVRRRAGLPVFLAVKNNRAYIGIHYERALFEPGISSTTSREAIEEMARQFALAETIVRELDLNTRIWTKEVDDSFLARPVEAPREGLDAVVDQARDGKLRPEQLWAAATGAVGASPDEGDAAPIARPPGTSIAIERGPGHATVYYGGAVKMTILIALWALSVLITVSAARALAASLSASTGLGRLGSVLASLPPVPVADAWTASLPIAWLLGAAIPGSLLGLSWMFRVRKVTVAPDAVRIHRGLRPWPRRYPRPPYERVLVVQRAVFIAKATGLNLINPSASPMLTDAEARWVAGELRQALRETATAR